MKTGNKIKVSKTEINRWLKAAEQGDARAQKNLGICYYEGEGVPQDYKKAVHWLSKSKEQGMDTPLLEDAKMFLEIERIGHVELAVPLTHNERILNTVPIIHSELPELPRLCRRIVNINYRLRKFIELRAPEIILRKEKRRLQRYVSNLLDKYKSEKVPGIKVETFPPTGKLPAWALPGGIPSAEDKARAEAIMKNSGLVPLPDAIKHMNATKAKEKEADAKVVKPKSSGSKKFKTESTHRSKQEQNQH